MARRAWGIGLGLCVAAMVSSGHAAAADELYKTLIGEGYEIKSVVILDPQFTTHFGNKIDNDYTALISLQKGGSSAACYIYVTDWINQNLATKKCAVLK